MSTSEFESKDINSNFFDFSEKIIVKRNEFIKSINSNKSNLANTIYNSIINFIDGKNSNISLDENLIISTTFNRKLTNPIELDIIIEMLRKIYTVNLSPSFSDDYIDLKIEIPKKSEKLKNQ